MRKIPILPPAGMNASPRPWRTGNHVGRTIYRQDVDAPRGVLIGVMDTVADAELVRDAVNAYGLPCPFDEDLRAGFQHSERRRRIAAVVADHHRDQLTRHQVQVPKADVVEALVAVLAALGGAIEPEQLGIVGQADAIGLVRAIVEHTGGEVPRG